MIKIFDSKGKLVHIKKTDIKYVKKYFKLKEYTIRSEIVLKSGKEILSCMSCNEINKLC